MVGATAPTAAWWGYRTDTGMVGLPHRQRQERASVAAIHPAE
jgi:hypothetical protein